MRSVKAFLKIKEMILKTLLWLNTICFGSADDGTGECFDTTLVVLRFLAAAAPQDKERVRSRTVNYNRHFPDKKKAFILPVVLPPVSVGTAV